METAVELSKSQVIKYSRRIRELSNKRQANSTQLNQEDCADNCLLFAFL